MKTTYFTDKYKTITKLTAFVYEYIVFFAEKRKEIKSYNILMLSKCMQYPDMSTNYW